MHERISEMIPIRMLWDVSVFPEKEAKQTSTKKNKKTSNYDNGKMISHEYTRLL